MAWIALLSFWLSDSPSGASPAPVDDPVPPDIGGKPGTCPPETPRAFVCRHRLLAHLLAVISYGLGVSRKLAETLTIPSGPELAGSYARVKRGGYVTRRCRSALDTASDLECTCNFA